VREHEFMSIAEEAAYDSVLLTDLGAQGRETRSTRKEKKLLQ
jgi:hypothetical protein